MSVATNWEDAYRVQVESIKELRAENADLRGTIDAVIAADERAVELWRAAHPGKELVIPDRAKLVEWLLQQNAALRKAKEMVELERCEMMRSMSLAQNQSKQLRADKERLDWLESGCSCDLSWVGKEAPPSALTSLRNAIDWTMKEAQP